MTPTPLITLCSGPLSTRCIEAVSQYERHPPIIQADADRGAAGYSPLAYMMKASDLHHLQRCVELAAQALEAGDEPFGSVLVAADGVRLFEDRNRVSGGDHTRHPEFEIARWAANNMRPEDRATATVYTSGEHCPMCAAAHGWVGLGRIVYASSSEQLASWLTELGAPAAPIRSLPIREIVPGLAVEGPIPELAEQVHALHRRFHAQRK